MYSSNSLYNNDICTVRLIYLNNDVCGPGGRYISCELLQTTKPNNYFVLLYLKEQKRTKLLSSLHNIKVEKNSQISSKISAFVF